MDKPSGDRHSKCRVALYIRSSAGNEHSLGVQKRALRNYCQENRYMVTHIYEDVGSLSCADMRSDLKQMLADARKTPCPFDVLLVYQWNRLSRGREELVVYKALLRKHGVNIKSITEPDDALAGSQMDLLIAAFVDELERDQRRAARQKNG